MRVVGRKETMVLLASAYSFSVSVAFVQLSASTDQCRRQLPYQQRIPRGWTTPSRSSSLSLSTSNEKQTTTTMQSKHKRKSDKTGPSAKKRSTYTKNGFKYQEKKSTTAKQQSDFAQFNQKITSQETAVGILNLLASRKGVLSAEAGGGNLSTVNFSTAIHRIAKHINNQNNNNDSDVGNDRGKVLSDPRFALFICSLSEAILEGAEINIDGSKRTFGAKELSNCAWGIAKLQIAPPKTVMPIDLEHVEENLMKKSQQVRSIILEIAKERASKSLNTKPSASAWIPTLSELCGLLIDFIGTKAMQLDPRRFKQQELSNLMYSATIVHRPSEEVFNFVVRSIILSASSTENRNKDDVLKPQEWSLPLWCLAKAELKSGHEEKLLPFLLDLMDNELGFLERFKPQELSNVAWGVATIISKRQEDATGPASEAALGLLRHATRELSRRDGIGYNTQELTNLAWAMATLGFGMIPGTLDANRVMANSYTNLESDDPEGDRALMHDSLSIIFREMKKKIRNFKSQELNNISWMMARLSESDDELFYMIGKELTNPERRIEATDLTVTLWSMATEEYINDDLYRAIAARLSTIEPHKFKPNELSNALWAFATAGVLPEDRHYFDTTLLSQNSGLNNKAPIRDPVVACYHLAAEEVRRRPNSFKPQELKDLLWSFVKVGMRHPSLFKFAAEHLVGAEDDLRDTGRGLDEFDVQAIANLAYVYARHCQLGAEVLQTYHEKCPIPQTGGRLACYTVSFLDIGEGLLRKLYSRIAHNQIANQGDIMVMSAQNVANIAWAFAIYGFKHPGYLDAVHHALQTRMGNSQLRYSTGSFGGQEIANTLWAFATLNYYPNGLLSVLEEHVMEYFPNGCNVEEISKVFTRQELANIAFSLCVFGEYPTRLVEMIFTGLLGNKDQCDPLYVQRVYGDSGIDQVHINSLIYLQIMLDLEIGRGKHPFSLPESFPQAWSEDVMFSSYSSDDINFSEINTSNTQVAVSKAFDRIGFPHVDEHIHSMMDLVREYGISMGAHPVNVLSMDIANVQSRIGIEIDGPGHWVSDISNDAAILNHIGYYRPNKNGILEYVFQWSTDDQEINGSTALKFRMFQKMGWKVINIPFWDWSKIYGNEKLEEEYAKNVLDKVL